MLAALLPTTLAGCAASNLPPPSLAVEVPEACESILRTVPAPPPIKSGDDLGVAAAKRGAALRLANKRIDGGRECVARVRIVEGAK